jgi:hypothetical protein
MFPMLMSASDLLACLQLQASVLTKCTKVRGKKTKRTGDMALGIRNSKRVRAIPPPQIPAGDSSRILKRLHISGPQQPAVHADECAEGSTDSWQPESTAAGWFVECQAISHSYSSITYE